jgi:tetratricopeptide (TPR) repeat protein
MLMAVGISLVGTWIVWKGVQVITTANVNFHRTQLRFHKKMKPAGVLFVLIAFLCLLFTLQSVAIGTLRIMGDVALARNNNEKALRLYTLAGPLTDGGIGFASNPNIDMAMAEVHKKDHNYREAERLLWRIDGRVGPDERSTMLIGQTMQYHQQTNDINSFYGERLAENEQWELIWEDYVAWLKREGLYEQAIATSKTSILKNPNAIRLQIQLALLEIEFGNADDAVVLARQMTETFPGVAVPWMLLSRALDTVGDHEGARKAQAEAAKIQGER